MIDRDPPWQSASCPGACDSLVEWQVKELLIVAAMIGAGAIWWLASRRELDAADVALRKKQAEKRARFAKAEAAEASPKPKPKARSFGNR